MYVHNFSTCETKTWKKKNSGLKGILTYDFCDAGPVLPELSSKLEAGHDHSVSS